MLVHWLQIIRYMEGKLTGTREVILGNHIIKLVRIPCSLTRSLTHSLTHPSTHSLTQPPIHSPTHSLTHSLTGPAEPTARRGAASSAHQPDMVQQRPGQLDQRMETAVTCSSDNTIFKQIIQLHYQVSNVSKDNTMKHHLSGIEICVSALGQKCCNCTCKKNCPFKIIDGFNCIL